MKPEIKKGWRASTALCVVSAMLLSTASYGTPDGLPPGQQKKQGLTDTTTPIKHVIILIGENRGLDHTFGVYKPKRRGETISNLLSKGIVREDGSPGPNYRMAQQFSVAAQPSYYVNAPDNAKYPYGATNQMPVPKLTDSALTQTDTSAPFAPALVNPDSPLDIVREKDVDTSDTVKLTTGYVGQKVSTCVLSPAAFNALVQGTPAPYQALVANTHAPLQPLSASQVAALMPGCSGPDTRVPAIRTGAISGPFPLWGAAANDIGDDDYTSDQTHRFFQDWQQEDCSIVHATNDNPSGCRNDIFPFVTSGAAMGFYNMEKGQVPLLKALADKFTLGDNFHQAFHGGTYANHVMLATGDAIFWNDGNGHPTPAPAAHVANPNPAQGTVNRYTNDGDFHACIAGGQPQSGAEPILHYLSQLHYRPKPNCEDSHYYMINNVEPAYRADGSLGAGYRNPPSSVRTIGDALSDKNISWAWYGGSYNDALFLTNWATSHGLSPDDLTTAALAGGVDPTQNPALAHAVGAAYCAGCNPFQYSKSIMANPAARQAHLKDTTDLIASIRNNTLPAVSFGKPDGLLDGHPASSKTDLFESYVSHILEALDANPALRAETAVFVTWDEAGGYWDSGYIQPIDYFGDGPRMPLLILSAYSTGGRIYHGYGDHVSLLKFIERNWSLQPVTHRSRDNLPNPKTTGNNPYVPTNSPALTDLFDAFDFMHRADIAYTH